MFEYQEIITDREQSAIRLDKFVTDRLPKISRNRIQNAIRAGSITVDGEEIKPNYKIRPYQKISILLPKSLNAEGPLLGEDIPLDIRYEDDDLMVIHKPPGLVVHPGVGNPNGTLVNALVYYFRSLNLPNQDSDRPGLVHRIDKDTSGLMVIAKTEFAMSHLGKQFFHHTIDRRYVALVWGEPDPAEGSVDLNIGRHPTHRLQRYAFPENEAGKWAKTHYRTLDPMYYVSLIECKLETGRTHQIRVHMKHLGHPLFNDALYGGDKIFKGTQYSKYKIFAEKAFAACPRQALHAKSLGFEHPTKGIRMFFESPIPEDMQTAMDMWKDYIAQRK